MGLATALDGARPRPACPIPIRATPSKSATSRSQSGVPYGGDPDRAARRTRLDRGRRRDRRPRRDEPVAGRRRDLLDGRLPRPPPQGIGRALTVAACRIAAERGCTHATLNATGEGELLYRAVGFESLGWGQTWWYRAGPEPDAAPDRARRGDRVRRPRRARRPRPTPAELARAAARRHEPAAARRRHRPDRVGPLDARPRARARPPPLRAVRRHAAPPRRRVGPARVRTARPRARRRPGDARPHLPRTPLEWVEHTGAAATGAVLAATPS